MVVVLIEERDSTILKLAFFNALSKFYATDAT